MNFIKIGWGLLTGLGAKTYVTLAVITLVSSTAWYLYDDIVVEPREKAEEQTVKCRNTLSEVNSEVANMIAIYDANISSLSARLKKCYADMSIMTIESFDKGYSKGILDAEVNQTYKGDIDSICFKPYF